MAESRVRVGGSGHTAFQWRGQTLGWLQTVRETAPRPVAQPTAIQPLDKEYPVEIATPRALGAGTLVLTRFELWDRNVWQELSGLASSGNLLDVFKRQVQLGNITCRKIVRHPGRGNVRVKAYYNCTITDVDDSETINIGTMEMPKGITIMYTHSRWI